MRCESGGRRSPTVGVDGHDRTVLARVLAVGVVGTTQLVNLETLGQHDEVGRTAISDEAEPRPGPDDDKNWSSGTRAP